MRLHSPRNSCGSVSRVRGLGFGRRIRARALLAMSLATAPAIDLGPGKGKGMVAIVGRDMVRSGQTDDDPLGQPFLLLRKRTPLIRRWVSAMISDVEVQHPINAGLYQSTRLFAEIAALRKDAQNRYIVADDEVECAGGGGGRQGGDGATSDAHSASAEASAVDEAEDSPSSDGDGSDKSVASFDGPPTRAERLLVGADERRAKKRRRLSRLARELSMPPVISVTLSRDGADDWTFNVVTRSSHKASPAMELNQHNLDMLIRTLIADIRRREDQDPKIRPGIIQKTAAAGYHYCYRSQRWYHHDWAAAGRGNKRRIYLDSGAEPPRVIQ